MKAREFDKKFDEGGDISQHLDLSTDEAGTEKGKCGFSCLDDSIAGFPFARE